jgi:cell division control protein 6
MDAEWMAGYLDRIGAGRVLVDAAPFSFDWLPPELVGRDKQLGELASMFMGIENPGSSSRAIISGPVGSGKTALARRLCLDLQQHLANKRTTKIAHINCRNHPTTTQVLQQISLRLDERTPKRGFGSGEFIQNIRRNLHSRGGAHLLLVLDEISVLLLREGDGLIYKLLRLDEGQDEQGTLSLILVSQEPILHLFEAAVISRFGQTKQLKVAPYDYDGLRLIIEQRAKATCRVGSIPDEVLDKLASFAVETGDARHGIELLESAIRRCEVDENAGGLVRPSDVKPSSRRHAMIEPHAVDELGEHHQLTLLAICRRLSRHSQITSGDAEKLYHVICEEFERSPRGHTSFWGYLKKLDEQGFIIARSVTARQGRGRTQNITAPNILPAALVKRIERLLQ